MKNREIVLICATATWVLLTVLLLQFAVRSGYLVPMGPGIH